MRESALRREMAATSIVLVPQFLKYSAGPLLGPTLLQSAARSRGHSCKVVDLNAMYIHPRVSKRVDSGKFVGDHDKPKDSLSMIEREFVDKYLLSALKESQSFIHSETRPISGEDGTRRRIKHGFLTHQNVLEASSILAESEFGCFVKNALSRELDAPPDVVGVSLLHSGQVIYHRRRLPIS